MSNPTNVFNIPANYHFFKSLALWLEKNFDKQLSEVKIFLPNRRSCREFREVLLHKNETIFLPKIQAISDISYEDFLEFLPNEEVKKIIDELLQIKVISGIEYLFFLSAEIQKLDHFNNADFAQAFKIALRLKDLFNEIEREEVDLRKLEEIDDSNLSKHRQITLEFLKDFHVQIKNSLLKQNIFFESSYQNLVFQKFTEVLQQYGSKSPIVIAGSTGSVSSSKKLIKTIAGQKNGRVILHALSADGKNFTQENHPNFFLNQLVEFLQIEKNNIPNIEYEEFFLSPKSRQNFLQTLMLPDEEVLNWQQVEMHLDVKNIATDLENNLQLIAAKNEIEEAKIISQIIEEAFFKEKTVALISNNQKLSELVKLSLESLNLPFNDSRSLDIFNSKLVQFLLLILELRESDFSSATLLALLKHPLCNHAKDKNILADFEIKILRKERSKQGLMGITEKLEDSSDDLKNFFNSFYKSFTKSVEDPANSGDETMHNFISQLIKTAENLSQKTWQELLINEPAQIELFEFFEKIKAQNLLINPQNILPLFKDLLAQINYFEKSDSASSIQILSTIEARLLNYDLMIISSLNDGDFPQIEGENWLGKKIKKDLGIDRNLKKIGQSAYDFCNYLSGAEVVMTYSKTRNNALLLESPFLTKFRTLCQKMGISLSYAQHGFTMPHHASTEGSVRTPNPKPPLEFRPQKISITEISKLIANPYAIYAKKILQLKELEKIDFESSYAEFGSFIHKALEEFIKNPEDRNFLDKASKIFDEYFLAAEAKLIWWPKFENIFADFVKQNEEFLGCKNYLEIPVKLRVGGNLISGKIDRIICDEEGLVKIFDYKTGEPPSSISVFSGDEPQLTIAALAMLEGVIDAKLENVNLQKISAISYWKLSSSSLGKIKKVCDDNEEIKILISAAQSGLEKLFKHFNDEENGYTAMENNKWNEYKNLARI